MTMDDFMTIMSSQSKSQVDSMYAQFAELCSDKQSNHRTALSPTPVVMSLVNILDAINQWGIDANDIAKNLCGIIPLYFRRDILCCYSKMQINKSKITINQVDSSICSIIAKMRRPIIISCWNNLDQIAAVNGKIVKNQDTWTINNIKVESLSIPMIPYQLCQSILIIEKEDAPYIDSANPNLTFIPASFSLVNDVRNTCYLGKGFTKTIGNECAILLNICNLWYNTNATVNQLLITK